MEEQSDKSRIVKCIVSMFVASVVGVCIAEIVANSLIEISLTYVFSIVFGIAFILLGVALTWRIWKSVSEPSKRYFMLFFAVLVFLSGIFSFFLEVSTNHLSPGAKVPMYMVVGIALSFALTFSLTEFINLGMCDKCCNTDFEQNPLISTPKQIFVIFSGSIIMGAVFGFMFGTIDVENDDSNHTKFKENLLYSIPVGAVIGGVLGFVNQYLRSSPRQYYVFHQNNAQNYSTHDNI